MRRFFSTTPFRGRLSRLQFGLSTVSPLARARLWPVLVALLVIAIVLQVSGVSPIIVVLVLGVACVIAIAAWRSARRKTEVIFGFYVSANEILQSEDRSRYRFEIADVIDSGENIVRSMPDPPPLSHFALGALYNSIGDHNGVVEHLGIAAEGEVLKESVHVSPSRLLRRYVKRLRQIERTPERAPKVYAAIKSLEGLHQLRAARMLAESQQYLKRLVEAYDSQASTSQNERPIFIERSLRSLTPPRPISELLNDIYQEEQPTS